LPQGQQAVSVLASCQVNRLIKASWLLLLLLLLQVLLLLQARRCAIGRRT
jgi:hypothetical protein